MVMLFVGKIHENILKIGLTLYHVKKYAGLLKLWLSMCNNNNNVEQSKDYLQFSLVSSHKHFFGLWVIFSMMCSAIASPSSFFSS